MIDGEVLEIDGAAEVKWCAKCASKYIEFPKLVAIREKFKRRSPSRQCCLFNKKNKLRRFLDKPWPPVPILDPQGNEVEFEDTKWMDSSGRRIF